MTNLKNLKPHEKWCKQCKRVKNKSEYMEIPRGWKINICINCARENMSRWEHTAPEYLLDMDRISRMRQDD